MKVEASYIGGRNNSLRFETEIEEEEVENFLKLILSDEPQRTASESFDFYSQSFCYMVSRGTYGENFRGVVAIHTEKHNQRIADIVRSFHNRPLYGWEDE